MLIFANAQDNHSPDSKKPIFIQSSKQYPSGYMMPTPAHDQIGNIPPNKEPPSNLSLDFVPQLPSQSLSITPKPTHAKSPNQTLLYLASKSPACANCRNFSTQSLRLFLGRLILHTNPIALSFEPIKGSLTKDDVTSEQYQLSHEYYENVQQLNAVYENELEQVKKKLQHIPLTDKDSPATIIRKLEAQFIFVCPQTGKTYWDKQWLIDRKALFMSGIKNQKGGSISHMDNLLGACSLHPDSISLESDECSLWRKSIMQYPPLETCSVLGNPTDDRGEILIH